MNKLKERYKKIMTNARWELRYKNLNEKYQALLEENKKLKKELDEDINIQRIWYLRKYIKHLRAQRDALRNESKCE